jgi:hypothetical protein
MEITAALRQNPAVRNKDRPAQIGMGGAFILSQFGGGHSWDFGTDRSYLLKVFVAGLSSALQLPALGHPNVPLRGTTVAC